MSSPTPVTKRLAIMILLCNIFFPSSILIGYIWSVFLGIKTLNKSY